MLTEDYIVRLINLGIRALLRIVGLRKSGDYEDALQLIDLTVEQLLGLKASTVKNLSDERLYDLLTRHDELDTQRLAIVADLLEQESLIFTAQNRVEEAREDIIRVIKFNLVLFFTDSTRDQAELKLKIISLAQNVELAGLDSDVLWSLASFYEESKEYIQAEALLLHLVERPGIRENIIPELDAFYSRLLAKNSIELAQMGLDSTQIQARRDLWHL
jgi:hypothetical protein